MLHSRIRSWQDIQMLYMPIVSRLHDEARGKAVLGAVVQPENVSLFLPSQIPSSLRETCLMNGLDKAKYRLRIVQAGDALDRLRRRLCVYSNLVAYKIKHLSGPGQRANTRARLLLSRFRSKIDRCTERYKAAQKALEALKPAGEWSRYFHPLAQSDIRGPNGDHDHELDDEGPGRRGEGRRIVSWIWTCSKSWRRLVQPAGGPDGQLMVDQTANEDTLRPCKVRLRLLYRWLIFVRSRP